MNNNKLWSFIRIILFVTVGKKASANYNSNFPPEIKLCSSSIVGLQCPIVCKVPNLLNSVSFFHPPDTLIATCPYGEPCKAVDNRFQITPGIDKTHITLTVPKLDKILHSGQWLCTYGGTPSNSANLIIYDAPKVYYSSVYLEPYEDEPLTLICDIDAQVAKYQYKWYRNNNELDQPSSSKLLHLDNISTSSKGIYICSVSFIGGEYTINSSYINIYNILKRKKEPEIKQEIVRLTAEEGQSLTLECDLYTKNQKVVWTFNGKLLKSNDGKVKLGTKGLLHIENIDIADIGNYTCWYKKGVQYEADVKNPVIYKLYAVSKTKRKDKPTTPFASILIWIFAYFCIFALGILSLQIISPADYCNIYMSLLVGSKTGSKWKIRILQILKCWILMSPIVLILKFPTHVTDIQDMYLFIFPSVVWILLLLVNHCLYTKILSGHLKDYNERLVKEHLEDYNTRLVGVNGQ